MHIGLAGQQLILKNPTLPGVLNEGQFPGGERRDNIGQYPVAWEYNAQEFLVLLRMPSKRL